MSTPIVSAPTTPPPDLGGEDPFRLQHEVFVRKSRNVCHQALYFVGLLRPTTRDSYNRAIEDFRPFALFQIRALVRGVRLSEDAYAALPESARREVAACEHWRRIRESLDGEDGAISAAGLEQEFADYLDLTREQTLKRRLTSHFLPDLVRYLRRRFAFFAALVLLLVVCLAMEAVSALIQNEGLRILLPLGLLLAPVLALRWRTAVCHARHVVPFWDLAGPLFRRFRHLALPPTPPIRPWPRTARLPARILLGLLAKLTAYLTWWLIAFLSLRALNLHDVLSLGDSSLTVFLILSLFYALLLLAYSADFWDFLDPAPVRPLLLATSAACLLFLLAGHGRGFFATLFAAGAAAYLVAFVRNRKRTLRLVLALVLAGLAIANLTGRDTIDRATWSDRGVPWQRLTAEDWPYLPAGQPLGSGPPVVVVAASGGGSRAAVYTGLTLRRLSEDFPEIAAQVQAISSVSGGSLASAAYMARLLERRPEQTGDAVPRAQVADLDRVLGGDFLLPTLQGALAPGTSRGDEIEESWRQGEIGLGQRRLSTIARAWRWSALWGEPNPPCPVPLFNTATLDAHDVVVTPLARDLYTQPELRADAVDPTPYEEVAADPADGALTWVFDRDGIYGLEDLLPTYDPLLSSAVRASANFPFGFPLVRIRTTRPLAFNPDPADRSAGNEKTVYLTDGGALSNSGMWPLANLLHNRADALRPRGVLLIIVEASKMPSFGSVGRTLERLWGTINDQAPIAQRLHRQMLDLLVNRFGDQLAIVQIDVVPRQRFNVLTTWALDGRSRTKLEEAFERRWAEESAQLRVAWERLSARPPGTPAVMRTRRPPLD